MSVKGIDVSHWQGNVDYHKVLGAGYKFVMIKCTQGMSYLDPNFNSNYTNAKAAGMKVGAYHYGTFGSVAQAKAEANYFISKIKGKVFTHPLVCDLEENKHGASKTVLTDALIAFLEVLESAGYFAMYYTGKYFLDAHLDATRLKPYASWIARYGVDSPGVDCGIWQYTQNGSVSGVSGDCDINVSYNDYTHTSPRSLAAAAPVTTAKAAVAVHHIYHTIVSGDTLSELADQYNTSVNTIMSLNHLTSTTIYVGQKLLIK